MRPAAHLLLIQNDYDIDFTVIDLPGEREVWATTSSAIDCWSSTMSRESCASIKRVGEGSGFEVMATEDPRTFQKAARSWRPTLIIMDLKMPGVDGIQLLRDLAADKCAAQVVLASGEDCKVLETALQLGRERGLRMRGMLQKPIHVETLRELLATFKPLSRTLLSSDLADAIAANHLFLEYQPKL